MRFGVVGWPVDHSRSPAMHNAAFAALGLEDHRYQHLPVPVDAFAATIKGLPGAGFKGANVTIPHKERALLVADEVTATASSIGAVNTLTFTDDGRIAGDNTDAPGFLAALPQDPTGRLAIVLGAGGSARAVVWALVWAGAEVSVWNRSPERAEDLAEELGAAATRDIEGAILVNCTSVGLDDKHATLVDEVRDFELVVDLVYRADGDTALVRAAREHGIPAVDGKEILVQQGALSFERWTGRKPPLDVMRQAAGAST